MENEIPRQSYNIFFIVKKNQLKMLKLRGFNIESEEYILNFTLDQFIDEYNTKIENEDKSIYDLLSNTYTKIDTNEQVYVNYPKPKKKSTTKKPKTGKEYLTLLTDLLDSIKIYNAILITLFPPSPTFELNRKNLPKYKIEVFQYKELYIIPTEHYLTGVHKILTKKQKIAYLKRSKLKFSDLPNIYTDDPVVKILGAKQGDIIAILREPVISGNLVEEYLYHRAVIEREKNLTEE